MSMQLGQFIASSPTLFPAEFVLEVSIHLLLQISTTAHAEYVFLCYHFHRGAVARRHAQSASYSMMQ
jgi:hypothetical protein